MFKRKIDTAWEHGTEVVEGDKKRIKCNYCSKMVGNITKLKEHLAKMGGNVARCPSVPSEVCNAIKKNLVQSHQKIGQMSDDGGQSSNPQTSRDAQIDDGDHCADVVDLTQVKIAYKGLTGACSEEAALAVYPGCNMVQCEKFEEALQAVESLRADKAIIPIENSLGGSFYGNYDLIYSHKLYIVGEVEVSMNLCLLALARVKLEDIKRVLGHPQALAQSKTFLSNLGVEKDVVDDELFYERFIQSNIKQRGAVIGSAKAAEIYALSVVADDIQDEKDSVTRFWILARDPIVPTNDTSVKSSIVFTLEQGPNELFKALSVFATREIKLTKVESRPQVNKLPKLTDGSTSGTVVCSDCLFYVDFKASMADSRAECALRHLKEFATSVRILGSYPMIEVSTTQ